MGLVRGRQPVGLKTGSGDMEREDLAKAVPSWSIPSSGDGWELTPSHGNSRGISAPGIRLGSGGLHRGKNTGKLRG